MTKFYYRAKKGVSDIVNGEIEAASQDIAIDKINEMGLVPIRVSEHSQTGNYREKKRRDLFKTDFPVSSFRKSRLRRNDLYTFVYQLSSLVKANVPILRSLTLISQQTESKILVNVVNRLKKEVRDGRMLSEAMEQYPEYFNSLYVSMIKSGERGGVLGDVLYHLTQYQRKEQEVVNKIQTALAYPLLMVVTGVATIFIMLTFFMPRLIGLFENMHQELPALTRTLIDISKFMSQRWHYCLFAVFLLIIFFKRIRSGGKKRIIYDMIKLRVPFIQKFVISSQMAKFSRTVSILLKNGMSIHESLELSADTLDNVALKMALKNSVKSIVNEGAVLSDSLSRTNILPRYIINMIAVGEEGGTLDNSLAEIANVYEEEVNHDIKVITSLLEPLLILGVGLFVGLIVFAMLLPIFSIGGGG